jgi:hypothetical protein
VYVDLVIVEVFDDECIFLVEEFDEEGLDE